MKLEIRKKYEPAIKLKLIRPYPDETLTDKIRRFIQKKVAP